VSTGAEMTTAVAGRENELLCAFAATAERDIAARL
jgi:hypothetical protein